MKKRIIVILLLVFIIAWGAILYKSIPRILENNREVFKSKTISDEETKKF